MPTTIEDVDAMDVKKHIQNIKAYRIANKERILAAAKAKREKDPEKYKLATKIQNAKAKAKREAAKLANQPRTGTDG